MFNPLLEQEMMIEAAKRKAAMAMSSGRAVRMPPAVGPLPGAETLAGLMPNPSGYSLSRAATTKASPAAPYPNGMTNNDVLKAAGRPPVPEIARVGPYAERGMTNDDVLAMRDARLVAKPVAPAVNPTPAPDVASATAQPTATVLDPMAGFDRRRKTDLLLQEKMRAKDAAIRQLQAMGPMQYDTPETSQMRSALIEQRKAAELGTAELAGSLRPREITTPEQDVASKMWLEQKLMGVNRDREAGMALPPSPEDAAKLATLPRIPTVEEVANSPEKLRSEEETWAYNARAKAAAGGMVNAAESDRAYRLREQEAMRTFADKQRQAATSVLEGQVIQNSPEFLRQRMETELYGEKAKAEAAKSSAEVAAMEGNLRRKEISDAQYNLENIDPQADDLLSTIAPTLSGLLKGSAEPGDLPAITASFEGTQRLLDRIGRLPPNVQSKYRQKILNALGNPTKSGLSTGSSVRAGILGALQKVFPTDAKGAYVQGYEQGNQIFDMLKGFLFPGG